jgi:hypothetical protein
MAIFFTTTKFFKSNFLDFLTLDSSLSYHDDEKLRFCLVLRWHVILCWTLEGFFAILFTQLTKHFVFSE